MGWGERGGEGLSKFMTDGLAGYPELDTDDGPGVVVTLDWLLLDDMLVESVKYSIFKAVYYKEGLKSHKYSSTLLLNLCNYNYLINVKYL